MQKQQFKENIKKNERNQNQLNESSRDPCYRQCCGIRGESGRP
jgi:hypothetical protein